MPAALPGCEIVFAADLDARDRAAGRTPQKSINASEWEGHSTEEMDS